MKPSATIDGAQVLEYAWSDEPFGVVKTAEGEIADVIHGLAICRYSESDVIYRFSCTKSWETSQDSDYASVEEAKEQLPSQYRDAPIDWQRLDTQ